MPWLFLVANVAMFVGKAKIIRLRVRDQTHRMLLAGSARAFLSVRRFVNLHPSRSAGVTQLLQVRRPLVRSRQVLDHCCAPIFAPTKLHMDMDTTLEGMECFHVVC